VLEKIRLYWGEAVWFLLIFSLPFTSLPLVSKLMGGTMVSPPAILILILLILAWLIPWVLRGHQFPAQVVPLLVFVIVVLIATSASAFLPIPSFRGIPVFTNSLGAIITLFIGVLFFLVAAGYPLEQSKLDRRLRWINWSGLIILAWSAVQMVYWSIYGAYPAWMYKVQIMISASHRLYNQRVTGLAYEPSWLAHQLNMLYLPLWMAMTYKRATVHRFRFLGITFENILLAGGVATLVLSISRVGLLGYLLTVAFLIFLASQQLIAWLRRKLNEHWTNLSRKRSSQVFLTVGMYLLLGVIYFAIFATAAVVISKYDPRMEDFLNPASYVGSFAQIANRLAFVERVFYWQTGWEIFKTYPWLGVGLGNAGYFFLEKMPPYGYSTVEISSILHTLGDLPNTKALWARLLSETGVLGFSVFFSWLFVLWKTATNTFQKTERKVSAWGLAGLLCLVALIIEGFSVDTFALPYYWLLLGWMTAASRISARNNLGANQGNVAK